VCNTVSVASQLRCKLNKYFGPPYCQSEMYAGHVICYLLMSHGEYADRTGQMDEQTDGPFHYAFC